MIDWAKTTELYGITMPKYRKRLAVICDECGALGSIVLTRVSNVVNNQMNWKCNICSHREGYSKTRLYYTNPEIKAEVSARSKRNWLNDGYREKVRTSKQDKIPQINAKISHSMKKKWKDPIQRAKWEAALNSDENKRKLSRNSVEMWTDDTYRNRMIEIFKIRSKKLWNNEEYRSKVVTALSNSPRLSELFKRRWANPEHAARMVSILQRLWATPEYREKMLRTIHERSSTDEFRSRMREVSREAWRDPDYRDNQISRMRAYMNERWADPAFRDYMSNIQNSADYKAAVSASSKRVWADPQYREKMAKIRAAQPRVSSLQTVLYSILDDLGVRYYREYLDKPADPECTIGPYTFDCVIPREGRPSLLIECQGEYWHAKREALDRSKATYISNNFPGQYELKQIWEHEFLNQDKVTELLKYWLGITAIESIAFEFGDIEIRPCPAQEYRLLLSKYHYLPTTGRGGIVYGAYLGDQLTAVCVFSHLVRQNIHIDNYNDDEVRELSRLCISPKYQKKNFATWFISRCIKMLPKQYKCIISYCDTTFNHDGATYKACNFILDSEVPPDYWYVSADGWVMHKRTLYGHARRMKMTENEYAESRGYFKVYGDRKLRFKYIR